MVREFRPLMHCGVVKWFLKNKKKWKLDSFNVVFAKRSLRLSNAKGIYWRIKVRVDVSVLNGGELLPVFNLVFFSHPSTTWLSFFVTSVSGPCSVLVWAFVSIFSSRKQGDFWQCHRFWYANRALLS